MVLLKEVQEPEPSEKRSYSIARGGILLHETGTEKPTERPTTLLVEEENIVKKEFEKELKENKDTEKVETKANTQEQIERVQSNENQAQVHTEEKEEHKISEITEQDTPEIKTEEHKEIQPEKNENNKVETQETQKEEPEDPKLVMEVEVEEMKHALGQGVSYNHEVEESQINLSREQNQDAEILEDSAKIKDEKLDEKSANQSSILVTKGFQKKNKK